MTTPAQDEERVRTTPTSAERIPTPTCPCCGSPDTCVSPQNGRSARTMVRPMWCRTCKASWDESKRALAQRAAEAVPKTCCGEYATCDRPCTPRGRWQANPYRSPAEPAPPPPAAGGDERAQYVEGIARWIAQQVEAGINSAMYEHRRELDTAKGECIRLHNKLNEARAELEQARAARGAPAEGATTSCWFVECSMNGSFYGWLKEGDNDHLDHFYKDPNRATKFTKERAEQLAVQRNLVSDYGTRYVATEHIWLPEAHPRAARSDAGDALDARRLLQVLSERFDDEVTISGGLATPEMRSELKRNWIAAEIRRIDAALASPRAGGEQK